MIRAHKIRLNPTPEQETYLKATLTLSERTWQYVGCGSIHNRDWNASKNIEQEAFRLAFDKPDAGSGYIGVSAWTAGKTSFIRGTAG